MKKSLIFIMMIVISIVLIPNQVLAKGIDQSKYNRLSLQKVFEEENISYDFSKYKETDDQVTIYLFRGHGCTYCSKFLNYLADTLLDKYGKYFKVVTYEVWEDANNADLMNQVASFMGDDASGVPYIIIGDKTFIGYAETMNSEIESAIKDLYDSKDRYDVFEKMATTSTNTKQTGTSNTLAIIISNILIATISVMIVIYITNRNKKELEMQIEELKLATRKGRK